MERFRNISEREDVPIFIVSAEALEENVLKCYDLGMSDFIVKPFDPAILKQRVSSVLKSHNESYGQILTETVKESTFNAEAVRTFDSELSNILQRLFAPREIEDPHHLKRVSMYSGIILNTLAKIENNGLDLNEDQIELIVRASSYHDIGKLAIPDRILVNCPDLSAEDFEVYKTHTSLGADMLQFVKDSDISSFIQILSNIAKYHHEKWNGSGYPEGLSGMDIPLCAQILSLAHDFDEFFTSPFVLEDFKSVAERIIAQKECYNPIILKALIRSEAAITEVMQQYSGEEQPLKT